MNKTLKRVLPLSIACILSGAFLASCGSKATSTYTYHDSISGSPENWNVATWKTNSDSLIQGYTQMGLVDYVLNDAKNGYIVVPEMASEIPTDISSSLTDEEVKKFGMSTKEDGTRYTKGQKFDIKLNQKATWEDGTKITADDYINSMKDVLDPKMQNYRASDFTTGNTPLSGGDDYLHSGVSNAEAYVTTDGLAHAGTASKDGWYFSPYAVMPWWNGMSLDTLYSKYKAYIDSKVDQTPIKKILADSKNFGTSSSTPLVYARIDNNAELKAEMKDACDIMFTALFGVTLTDGFDFPEGGYTDSTSSYSLASACFRYYTYPEYSWDKVGLIKVNDYELNYFFKVPVSDFNMKQFFSGNWLIKQDLWDANRKAIPDSELYATTYATSTSSYMAYGPYRLDTYQQDKQILIKRNNKWYGYTDDQHKNQFQVDAFDISIIDDEAAVYQSFLKGDLDGYALRGEDMDTLGTSSRLMYTPQSYTTKLTVNSVFEKLKAIQDADNLGNHTILSNINFRKALSLGLDRKTLVQKNTAGWRGFDVPINFMYASDPDTGALYRDTTQGQRVVTDNFGKDADGKPNYFGYDVTEARKLIDQAVTEETASTVDGHYTEGQKVHFIWESYNSGWDTMVNWVVAAYKDLMKGTKLEGKFDITVKITGDSYADHIRAGSCDFGISTWGGAQFDPYGILEVYTKSSKMYETANVYSTTLYIDTATGDWSTEKGKLTAATVVADTLGAPDGSSSAAGWSYQLSSGKYSEVNSDTKTRLNILSACESYLVGTYNFISWGARQSVTIDSYRVSEATDTYIQIVGFGGIRFMKLTMDDAAWAAYVSKNATNGVLDYTK